MRARCRGGRRRDLPARDARRRRRGGGDARVAARQRRASPRTAPQVASPTADPVTTDNTSTAQVAVVLPPPVPARGERRAGLGRGSRPRPGLEPLRAADGGHPDPDGHRDRHAPRPGAPADGAQHRRDRLGGLLLGDLPDHPVARGGVVRGAAPHGRQLPRLSRPGSAGRRRRAPPKHPCDGSGATARASSARAAGSAPPRCAGRAGSRSTAATAR